MQDATAKKMLCFIFFNDKTLTSCSLTMFPTVGVWFSLGPVDVFLMDRWMVFSWTNTLVFTLQLHHVQIHTANTCTKRLTFTSYTTYRRRNKCESEQIIFYVFFNDGNFAEGARFRWSLQSVDGFLMDRWMGFSWTGGCVAFS